MRTSGGVWHKWMVGAFSFICKNRLVQCRLMGINDCPQFFATIWPAASAFRTENCKKIPKRIRSSKVNMYRVRQVPFILPGEIDLKPGDLWALSRCLTYFCRVVRERMFNLYLQIILIYCLSLSMFPQDKFITVPDLPRY